MLIADRSISVKSISRLLLCSLLITFSCLSSFALNPDWQIYQYGHRAWKIEDGFLGSTVNAISQDRDGYLWIGTNNGLFRFDGIRFAQWNPPEGNLPSSYILSLLADRDGTLWISTQNGISHWDHHHLTHFKEYEGSVVFSMQQDEDGGIWFAPFAVKGTNDDVLCNIAHGKTACYGGKEGLTQEPRSRAFFRDASKSMWIGGSASVTNWKDGSIKTYAPKSLEGNGTADGIFGLAGAADGSLLVGINKRGPGLGLQHLKNGRWYTVTAPAFDGSQHQITTLFEDRHHTIWIGTGDEGLYRLYKGKVEHFGRQDGLSSNHISTIHEDKEGSLWVGTSEGLDQFRDLAVQGFSKTVYPKSREFDNLVTLADGTLWVGGDSTLYTLRNDTSVFTRQGGDLNGKQVTTIFGDRGGRVWIGLDNTLNLFSNGKFTPVRMADGSSTGFIVSMAEDAVGGLWAVSTGPPRKIISIDSDTLLASPVLQTLDVSKITGDTQGGLWLGTNSGDISHYFKGTITNYPFKHDSHLRISQLLVLPNNSVLAASEFGLAYISNKAVHVLNTHSGLPCAGVSKFVFDSTGDLWLYMQCGLVRVSQSQIQHWFSDPSAQIETRTFAASDGFRTQLPPFEGAARSGDGRLWFNGMDSLQMVDPAHMHLNTLAPPVHIEGIRVDFRDYTLADAMQLPPLTRDIEITYTATSFAAPQNLRFRYKLMGFDPEWHDVGARRQAVYMNLKPGAYVFQVIACNNDGVWNRSGDTLRFTIAPAFYQTRWFLICAILAGSLLIYTIFVIRVRISTRMVEGRMNERLMERDRIARELHDTLLQGFQGIVLRLQGVAGMIPDSSPVRQALEETMDRADDVLIDGRQSLLQLRSNTSRSLSQQLKEVIADLRLQNDLPCELVVHGEERLLIPTVQEEVLAIGREAITNAFRHSRAMRVFVDLSFTSTHLSLEIRDDGVGLPLKVLEDGYAEGRWGLIGLRERADKVRARLGIRNNEPRGTHVEFVLQARVAYSRQRS